MIFKWEMINEGNYQYTYRAKVIGGWIFRHKDINGDNEVAMGMVFIPDTEHKWEITK